MQGGSQRGEERETREDGSSYQHWNTSDSTKRRFVQCPRHVGGTRRLSRWAGQRVLLLERVGTKQQGLGDKQKEKWQMCKQLWFFFYYYFVYTSVSVAAYLKSPPPFIHQTFYVKFAFGQAVSTPQNFHMPTAVIKVGGPVYIVISLQDWKGEWIANSLR